MIRFREIVLGLIGAALTLLVTWALPNLVQSWEWKTYDLRFQWRGKIATHPDVILIDADDESAKRLGRWPWKRTLHAHLIDTLLEQKPGAVAYDVLFALPENSLEDRALERSVKSLPNLVFPVAVHLLPRKKDYTEEHNELKWDGIAPTKASRRYFFANRAIFPLKPLTEVVGGLGHIATNRDEDGVIRRVPLLVRYRNRLVPSLAFHAVLKYLDVPADRVRINSNEVVLQKALYPGAAARKDISIPVDKQGQMLINFAGRWSRTFKHASFYRVLEKEEAVKGKGETLEGKLVLVANTLSGFDSKPIPVEKDFPGVGVHANIINTILTQNFLQSPSWMFQGLLIFLLAVAVAQFLAVRYVLIQVGLVILLVGAYGVVAGILFGQGLVLPMITPLATVVVTAVWVSMYNAWFEHRVADSLGHEKIKLEGDLETAAGHLALQVQEMERSEDRHLTETSELQSKIQDLRVHSGLGGSLMELTSELLTECREHGIVTREESVAKIFRDLKQVASSASSILLLGESGTGKELFAHAAHHLSGRRGKFVTVNLAACPEGLVESELFGHVKGSFTGATSNKPGRFREADGGTIFLDEIGEIKPDIQVKLLRVLQEREVQPIGDSEVYKVDVRVVSATNKNLEAEIQAERFRSDLFYRLNTIAFNLPPLRERPRDIELLAWHFLDRYKDAYNKEITGVSKKAMEALLAYGWPGNVRELENVLQRGVTLAPGTIIQEKDLQLPEHAVGSEPPSKNPRPSPAGKEEIFLETLRECGFEINAAAKQLEVSRNTVSSRFKGVCFEMLVEYEGDAEEAARVLAGDTDYANLIQQKVKEYHKNLLKPLVDFEDPDVAVRDALKRQRNVPTQYHSAIEKLVRKGL